MEKIYVLMSVYNGEKYLKEQVESILNQKDVEVELYIRDDGSSDSTIEIINGLIKKDERIRFIKGENLGVKFSFLELLKIVDSNADYYSFCDQDDYWMDNKLIEAVKMIKKEPDINRPILYYSHTTLVDDKLEILNVKNPFNVDKAYDFGEIMIKNCASGCTMVFNKELKDIVNNGNDKDLLRTPLHDHWLYMICLAVGGRVVFDNRSFILYRQHSGNVVGAKRKLVDKFKESPLFRKDNIRYSWAIQLNNAYASYIDDDNAKLLSIIINYKTDWLKTLKLATNRYFKPTNFWEKLVVFFTVIRRGY